MVGPHSSSQALADHYRDLAQLMSDDRTHHVLLEMARELDERGRMPQPIVRSLS